MKRISFQIDDDVSVEFPLCVPVLEFFHDLSLWMEKW
jgi:hypothetical protein